MDLTSYVLSKKYTDSSLADMATFTPLEGIEKIQSVKSLHIFAGIDSLTAGANGDSYLNFLEPTLRSQMGDGGGGLHMLDYQKASENGASLGKSNNMLYMKDQLYSDVPKKYSICGLGLYTTNGSGSDSVDYTVNRKFTNARLFYLQQPGGGTFAFGSSNIPPAQRPVTNTAGTLDLKYVDVDGTNFSSSSLSISNITGAVAVFGIFFTNGTTGVTVSRLAVGGSKMSEHASLDSSFRQKWFSLLQPNLYILNGGMNDRITTNASDYQTNVMNFLNDIKTASANTQILLVASNESSDVSTTNLKDYPAVLKNIASANKYGYFSNKDFMGDYNKANSRGLMFDGVHPNTRGNQLIALKIAEYLGFKGSAKQVDADQFTVGVATKQYVNPLTSKFIFVPAATATQKIYDIGIVNGSTVGFVKVRVVMGRQGTQFMVEKEYRCQVLNSSASSNQVSAFNNGVETQIYQYAVSNNANTTLRAVIESNRLAIYADNTLGVDMDLVISGTVELLYLPSTGKSVWEN
jgi:lysophospholipase L1-like esterase